jgi:hypothetical protein
MCRQDHWPVGVTFRIGDGTANEHRQCAGEHCHYRHRRERIVQRVPHAYSPYEESFISNSGDLTREKIAKLVEMSIDNAGG